MLGPEASARTPASTRPTNTPASTASSVQPAEASIVAPMRRQCCRPACAEPAVATVTYHYGTQAAWVDPLSAERDPHSYDMCARHAERLRPPQGWALTIAERVAIAVAV